MIVMKFGGSSVAEAKRISHVADIIASFQKKTPVIVVVSALAGVTDTLIHIFEEYKTYRTSPLMLSLYEKHLQAAEQLGLDERHLTTIKSCLYDHFKTLQSYLDECQEFSERNYAYIVSFGERFSSCLLATALDQLGTTAISVDAASVIVAEGTPTDGKAALDLTKKQADKVLLPLLKAGITPIVTGFYGADSEGGVMTLGRGGSDYSATILANTIGASEVILWKEVDGVYTGDPKTDPTAQFYPSLSYQQALDLAQKGAKILHPEAMKPVAEKSIVVWVKNTFKPQQEGTKIWIGQ